MSPTDVQELWIESEHAAPIVAAGDDNSDVVVRFRDGSKWVATFFTYRNIASLRLRNRGTGECLSGKYFWASDLILIDEITRPSIEAVIADLLETGEFTSAFTRVET